MIAIKKDSDEKLYMQLYRQIKNEILEGTLRENDMLQGTRTLARTLEISRNTVENAYRILEEEGYIESKRSSGYRVAEIPVLRKGMVKTESVHKKEKKSSEQKTVLYDLTNSSYTSELFPRTLWRKYTIEGLNELEKTSKISAYLNPQGEEKLRHHLKLYLERIRGVRCSEEQIVITAGSQQSLDIICKILPESKKTFIMEEPGYNKAAAVLKNNGKIVKGIPVDDKGLITDRLPFSKKIAASYVTPSHQFPTGAIMSVSRRFKLSKWAAKNDSYIIEDDYDSELRFYAKPIPSLASIDSFGRVIYLGTFSKALSPSVRMSYLILPEKLLGIYRKKFADYNCTVPLLNQYIASRILETSEYDRHVRHLNGTFKKRLELFKSELKTAMPEIEIKSNGTGQYFLLGFPGNVSSRKLMELALEKKVRVYETMQFWQEKAECPKGLLFLGFSKIDLKDIPDCVSRLKDAWEKHLGRKDFF